MKIFTCSLIVLTGLVCLVAAEDKSSAAPTLTDTQRVVLLQAEVKVLTSQVENLQAQCTAKEKELAFKTSLTELYKQGEVAAKETGADKTDFDLDLATLTFKVREKPTPVVTPAPGTKK